VHVPVDSLGFVQARWGYIWVNISSAGLYNLSLCIAERPERARRFSMENMEIMKLTPDKKVCSL